MRLLNSVSLIVAVLVITTHTAIAGSPTPNFIIINIDDLGYGDIGPFGSTHHRTPHLDRMAAEGRKLTCFYAAPVCSPSRASLMTGCYPKRALSIRHVLFPEDHRGLAPAEVTIAELLQQRGYATGIVGKWHLGDQPQFLPMAQGFDEYFGIPYSNDMGPTADGTKSNLGAPLPTKKRRRGEQPPLPLLRNDTVLQRVLPNDQQQIVERYTQEAVSFLWRHRDEPFFLYLPHSAVHFPLYPSEDFRGQSQNGLFGDWVEEVDWSVGQILDTVRQLNLSDNTLVLFTSDNGGAPKHGASNAPLRGGKGTTFEGGMRVPTIAWWPGQIPAGTSTDQVSGMMDVLPTFIKLAGGTIPSDRTIDGGDLWPVLAGQDDAQSPHDTFLFYRGQFLQAVRQGPWKLHLKNGDLYHLQNDIAESTNVADEHADIVAQLRDIALAADDDLGREGVGPGCRTLGQIENPQPLIGHDGITRSGFEAPDVYAGQGIMMGEVSSTSAHVQVRLTSSDRLVSRDLPGTEGVVEFVVLAAAEQRVIARQTIAATPEHDFIARASFRNLQPGTRYICRTAIGRDEQSLRAGPTAEFRTHPGADNADSIRLVVVTGMNYSKFHGDDRIDRRKHILQNNTALPDHYTKPDKHLGYPALDAIRRLQPDFFVGTGDNIYYDSPSGDARAVMLEELRQKWHEQFVQPRYHELFAVVPTYWMVDDHDYRVDDCDNTGDYEPSPATGRRLMLEQLPYGRMSDDDTKTFRTHRVSRDLQVWFPENRLYRSPNATPDGPDKTIWGAEQKAWLKQTLTESDATFRLLISPTPMIGPDDKRKTDNHTNIGGFQHERDEFFAWLNNSGVAKNFYLVCGDRHWQYHSVHPSGMEEFSSGALVDANSRPGRLPGDPKSTDPEGQIKQPYSQDTPSGGFLEIESLPATDGPARLTFRFHDEHGAVLYEHSRNADRN